jgi:hypothetical protein
MHDLGNWTILWSVYNRQHDISALVQSRTIKDVTWSFFIWRNSPLWPRASWFTRFLYHTQRHGRTPLEEWSTCRRDLYLITHNTHDREVSTPPVGFEHTVSAGERLQTYALDCANTGDCIKQRKWAAVLKNNTRVLFAYSTVVFVYFFTLKYKEDEHAILHDCKQNCTRWPQKHSLISR